MNLSRKIAQVSSMISSRNYNPFMYCVFCIDCLVVVEYSILAFVNGVKNYTVVLHITILVEKFGVQHYMSSIFMIEFPLITLWPN